MGQHDRARRGSDRWEQSRGAMPALTEAACDRMPAWWPVGDDAYK